MSDAKLMSVNIEIDARCAATFDYALAASTTLTNITHLECCDVEHVIIQSTREHVVDTPGDMFSRAEPIRVPIAEKSVARITIRNNSNEARVCHVILWGHVAKRDEEKPT